jgi:hypothetical protein
LVPPGILRQLFLNYTWRAVAVGAGHDAGAGIGARAKIFTDLAARRADVACARRTKPGTENRSRKVATRWIARSLRVRRRESVGTDSRDLRLAEAVNTPANASGAKNFSARTVPPC